MHRLIFTLCVLLASLSSAAVRAESDPVLFQQGSTVVRLSELKGEIEQSIPADKLSYFFGSERQLRRFAGNYFVVRKLADEATARALSDAEALRVDSAKWRALSQVQLDHLVGLAQQPDFEKLALEEYRAYPERFAQGESRRVAHILVSTKDRELQEAERLALELLGRLKADSSLFSELAKAHSDDSGSAEKGGDLGYITKGRMVPEFEAAAFGIAAPGSIEGPIKTQFGLHIILLEDIRAGGTRPFDEVRGGIVAKLEGDFRASQVNKEIERITNLPAETNLDELLKLHKPLKVPAKDATDSN